MTRHTNRALIKPDPKPASNDPPPHSVDDDDEGYIDQPAPAPAPATNANLDDADEGYLPDPAPAAGNNNVAPAPALDDLDEGYITEQPTKPTNSGTTPNAPDSKNDDSKNDKDDKKDDETPGDAPEIIPAYDWQNPLFSCDEPASCGDFFTAFFIPCCQIASAKSQMDGSSWCYNCCCWSCVGGATFLARQNYSIFDRYACGTDCATALMCFCCSAKRVSVEIRHRSDKEAAGALYLPPFVPIPEEEREVEMEEQFMGCAFCNLIESTCCPCLAATNVLKFMSPEGGEEDVDCCYVCWCVNPYSMYGHVRHRYGLKPQICCSPCLEDTVLPCICGPCALNTAVREARYRSGAGGPSSRHSPNSVKPSSPKKP